MWDELRARRTPGEDLTANMPVEIDGTDTGFELSVDASGNLHLLKAVEGPSQRPLPPAYSGLQLQLSLSGGQHYMDLNAPAAYATMFATLCGEVIDNIYAQNRDTWAATINIIHSWYSAWRTRRPTMSRSMQTGLAGELLILRMLWLPALGSEAVHLWSGADRERHDFVSDIMHMEVKTTTKSRHEHEISRVDQLLCPADRRLLLASVQLEASIAGAQSIATLIDAVLSDIGTDGAALDAFQYKLGRLDWDDEMRQSPELLKFHLRNVQIFEVDDEFPALPKDFQLPDGVLSIQYTISLANLPFLNPAEVHKEISKIYGN